MAKIGRNDLCPCGSGKKFKKCCIDRIHDSDNEIFSNPENFIKNYKKLRHEAKIKQCLHPRKDECSERIIKAHSIQNNKILNRIANNGLVYMPCPKFDSPFETMTKYGRKEATIFTGFCSNHDKIVFQPIEDNSFDKSIEHVFLYTYRCFSVEYHKKQEVENVRKGIYQQKPSLLKLPKKNNLFRGSIAAIDDLKYVKDEFDKALLNESYDILTSIVWEFNQPVNFAGTGFEAITNDLKGNRIQDLTDFEIPAKHIFVMIFPENEKTYCIISWLKKNDDLFSEFYSELLELNESEKKNYINNLLPIMSENIAINPLLWEKWNQNQKEQFMKLIWGEETLLTHFDIFYNRLLPTKYDLFEI